MDTRPSIYREDSDLRPASLLQLDPTPICTPPALESDEEKHFYSTEEDRQVSSTSATKGASTRAPGLSGSGGHGTIYYLTRIQRYSSYAMSIFLSLHLANVSLIPAVTRSVAGSESYLLMTRELYQTTVSEPLLVGLPVLAHVGSGVAMRLIRRWQNAARYGGTAPALHMSRASGRGVRLWPSLSYISASGYIFVFFYSAHALVNRGLPLVVEGDSSNIGLAYVAHGFARHPVLARVAYIGLIAVGCGHMVWGAAKWLAVAPSTKGWYGSDSVAVDKKIRKQRRWQWFVVHAVATVSAAAWAVGGLGVVSREGLASGWIGKLYDEMFARVGL